MARLVRIWILSVGMAAWALSGDFLEAAPAWESGGRPYEVSDLQSVVVAPRPMPDDGQPPLPPEPESAEEIGLPVPADVPDGVVVEDAKAPTLTERLQEFIPSPPNLMAFDYESAAVLESDGQIVHCPERGGLCGPIPESEGHCWILRLEAMALWRSAPRNRPIFATTIPGEVTLGPTALNANQLNSDPLAAPRISLFRADSCGNSVEATYMWAGNFYSQRSLPTVPNGYATSPPGIYGNEWGPTADPSVNTSLDTASARLIANFQSAEFNRRIPLGWGATKFLGGFRWIQWNESLSMQDSFVYDEPPAPPVAGNDFYTTNCFNNLYGGQIGLDSMLWNSGKGLRLEGLVKAGAYANVASQNSAYQYGSDGSPFFTNAVSVRTNPALPAFVGEVGLTGVMPITRNLELRCGYFGLWLEGLVQPTNLLSGQNLTQLPPSVGSITATGGTILQGVSLSLQAQW